MRRSDEWERKRQQFYRHVKRDKCMCNLGQETRKRKPAERRRCWLERRWATCNYVHQNNIQGSKTKPEFGPRFRMSNVMEQVLLAVSHLFITKHPEYRRNVEGGRTPDLHPHCCVLYKKRTIFSLFKIWGFKGSDYEESRLLGWHAVWVL
jgi:hypothetical protein